MPTLDLLLKNNKLWSKKMLETDSDFFKRLTELQAPKFLWIGCSDSRVPANQILGLAPGEVFVHRNVANLVVNTDINCLSVIQYAVEILQVEHIIVCGHYGCGGVRAACGHKQLGLIDNWLRNIKNVYTQHEIELENIRDDNARVDRLCELNVLSQVQNVCRTTIVQNAWKAGKNLSVNGFIYDLNNGLLQDLAVRISSSKELEKIYKMHEN
jgi:carbonic anhydrase